MFYVYAIMDGVVPVYVGKGSKRRLKTQERRFGLRGKILEHFECEASAYRAERKWIKALNPSLNKHPGGNGCTVKKVIVRTPRWLSAINRIGTKAYAARLVLACFERAPHLVDSSKVDALRSAGYGNRA